MFLKRIKRGREKEETQYKNTSIFKSDIEGIKFWHVKEGTHFFDIVMYEAGKNDPDCEGGERTYVFEPFIHRQVGPDKRDVICLKKTYNKPCPICERVAELLDAGTDWGDIDFKVQKNPRSIYNVVVRDNAKTEKEGVQVAHFSHFTMEQHLLDLAEEIEIDESSGEPVVVNRIFYFDPEEGKKIQFKRKGKGQYDTEYLGHQFKNRNYKIDEDLEKGAFCLDEIVHVLSYEEIKVILSGEEVEEEDDYKGEEEEINTDVEVDELEEESEEEGDEEEPEEEEESEEPDPRGELEGLSRALLKKYIKDNKLEVKVVKSMEDSDIVDSIIKVVEGTSKEEDDEGDSKSKKGSGSKKKCPGGGTFGEDLEELDYCEKCKIWKDCVKKSEEKSEENE